MPQRSPRGASTKSSSLFFSCYMLENMLDRQLLSDRFLNLIGKLNQHIIYILKVKKAFELITKQLAAIGSITPKDE